MAVGRGGELAGRSAATLLTESNRGVASEKKIPEATEKELIPEGLPRIPKSTKKFLGLFSR